MKVLTINCSPKTGGNTSKLLDIFIKESKRIGLKTINKNLYDEKINFFNGKLNQKITKLTKIQKLILECDAFVIATPTYWFNMPAVLKNLIDNLTQFEENNWMLEGKVAGIIVYEPEGGGTEILKSLSLTFNHMGIVVPPYSLIFYRGKQDNWAISDIKLLARVIKEEISMQKILKGKKVYEL